MDEIKKNVYITYVEVLQDGYKTLLRTLRTPNPEFEAYGANKCNEILSKARLAVEKITYNMLKDYKDDIKRVGNPELSQICHEFFMFDLNGCLGMVAEPLQTEWWMLANRLKQRFMDLEKLEIIYVENINNCVKDEPVGKTFDEDVKQTKKLERRKELFEDIILKQDKERYLTKLKERMKGMGKDAAIQILFNDIQNKCITKFPTYRVFCETFPEIEIPESTYSYKKQPYLSMLNK
jgi:hypothetical protein